MKLLQEVKNELDASQEVSTYLEGLRDALSMTKPQLKASINYLENSDYEAEVE